MFVCMIVLLSALDVRLVIGVSRYFSGGVNHLFVLLERDNIHVEFCISTGLNGQNLINSPSGEVRPSFFPLLTRTALVPLLAYSHSPRTFLHSYRLVPPFAYSYSPRTYTCALVQPSYLYLRTRTARVPLYIRAQPSYLSPTCSVSSRIFLHLHYTTLVPSHTHLLVRASSGTIILHQVQINLTANYMSFFKAKLRGFLN